MNLEQIKQVIEKDVPDSTAYILDPMQDGQHLQAIVVSPAFKDIMLVKQHQMVKTALKEALSGPVHALSLKTYTPEKWEDARQQFGL